MPAPPHKLRIAVKKLHYACGFFAALFGDPDRERRRRRFGSTLKKIQDALGTLNDIEVQSRSPPQSHAAKRRPESRRRKPSLSALSRAKSSNGSKPVSLPSGEAAGGWRN
jgi:CHAD domain-containing protein